MAHYFTAMNHYLQAHAQVGLWLTFAIAFAESLPIIGTILPGSIAMSVIGILAGRGLIPISAVLFLASLGALIGDTFGFWVGKYYNERLRTMWPFKKHPQWLILSEKFFAEHGGKSIVIGRFVGPARSSVPLIAGLLKMTWPRFFMAAIPSALLWAIAYITPGILIGAISLELPPHMTTKFMLIALTVIILIWLVIWSIQRFFVFLANFFNRLIDRLWAWLNRHHASQFFIRAIRMRHHPENHHQLTLVILFLFSMIIFLLLLAQVAFQGILTAWNEPLFHFLQSIHTAHTDKFFVTFTLLGAPIVISIFAILYTFLLCIKKQWHAAMAIILLLLAVECATSFFKLCVHAARPILTLSHPYASFPSGHMTFTTAILCFVAFLTSTQIKKTQQWIAYTLTGVLIFMVGLSRLYLGAHWLTDVLGGLFLGLSVSLLTIVIYRRQLQQPFFPSLAWGMSVILALLIPWGTLLPLQYHKTIHEASPVLPIHQIAYQTWWEHPTDYLPIYRVNRFGKSIQPFNIQWAGSLEPIKKYLTGQGWATQQHSPLFQPLYRQRHPALFLVKRTPHNTTVIELRLWRSGVRFNDNPFPLWIGTVQYHHLHSPHNMTRSKQSPSLIQLTQDLSGLHRAFKIITIPPQPQPKKVRPLDWDGTIIIISNKDIP